MLISLIFGYNLFKFIFLAFNNASEHLHSKNFIYDTFNIINCLSEAFFQNTFASVIKKLFMVCIKMDAKKILFALVVTTLLAGSVCAASVNDFKVDSSYSNAFSSDYYSVYLNGDGDSGVAIYKNVNDDLYDDLNDDAVDNIVHDDANEYLVGDDDMQITKNADNTANFKDYDHVEHGVAEVVQSGGDQYVVVFFAKDSSSIDNADLMAKLTAFNKDNNVKAVAF
jgi:hypothetical protein